MRISDWSSDVCSSDLPAPLTSLPRCWPNWTVPREAVARRRLRGLLRDHARLPAVRHLRPRGRAVHSVAVMSLLHLSLRRVGNHTHAVPQPPTNAERLRSEEHTSELQSLMRTSYA